MGEPMTDLRLGDYVLILAICLNLLAMILYGWQGHWKTVGYWSAVAQLNFWLLWLR
jgi:hypothetical protein